MPVQTYCVNRAIEIENFFESRKAIFTEAVIGGIGFLKSKGLKD